MQTLCETAPTPKRRLIALHFAAAALLALACSDPLPPEASWLAGKWQWLSSCCTILGTGPVADAPDALVLDLHYNGDAEIYDHGVELLRTRFEVVVAVRDTLLRFQKPVLHATQFAVTQLGGDRIRLAESPNRCDDCPDVHAFVRAP